MNIKSLFILTAAGITLAACQSNTYQVKGSITDGTKENTLYLTTDFQQGTPRETIIVEDGRFELSGETDSTYFCMIYGKNEKALNIPFFMEPGTIKIVLSKTPGGSRVGGTALNDEWQRMTDSTMVIGLEINNIAEKIYSHQSATMEEQQKGMEQIEKLNQRFNGIVLNFTKRNINNELGYFLLTTYPDDVIPPKTRLQLIQQLPKEKQNRKMIQQMVEYYTNAQKTEEGSVIEDFTMSSIGGIPMSIMSEVKKNKITVFDFWASWCGPCRSEMPRMKEIYQKYKDQGLGFVGISLDSNIEAWKKATAQEGIEWPQMSDLKGWKSTAAALFNITAIPYTIIVDQNGKILRRDLHDNDLDEFIASLLQS